jgi:hypothetical protein
MRHGAHLRRLGGLLQLARGGLGTGCRLVAVLDARRELRLAPLLLRQLHMQVHQLGAEGGHFVGRRPLRQLRRGLPPPLRAAAAAAAAAGVT